MLNLAPSDPHPAYHPHYTFPPPWCILEPTSWLPRLCVSILSCFRYPDHWWWAPHHMSVPHNKSSTWQVYRRIPTAHTTTGPSLLHYLLSRSLRDHTISTWEPSCPSSAKGTTEMDTRSHPPLWWVRVCFPHTHHIPSTSCCWHVLWWRWRSVMWQPRWFFTHPPPPGLASDLYSYHQPKPCSHSSTLQVKSSLGITSSSNGPRMVGVLAACLNGIVIRGARCVIRRDWCNPYARNLCL